MSFFDCIDGKKKSGEINDQQAKAAREYYDRVYSGLRKKVGDEQAAYRANVMTMENMAEKAQARRAELRHALYQQKVTADLETRLKNKTAAYNKLNKVQKALILKPSYDGEVRDLYERAFDRTRSIRRTMIAELNEFAEAMGSKLLGFSQDTTGMKNVVRAVLGESVDGDAAQFGKTLSKVFNSLRKMYDDAGGVIGKIDKYFPQRHRPDLVRASSFEEWRDYMLPRLDTDNMINRENGMPFTAAELDKLMRDDYEAISTRGLSELEEIAKAGGQMPRFTGDVFRRRDNSRFYKFKNADAFLEYNAKYGYGDAGLFEAVISHIEVMSRDIGMMQVLGTKPNALARHLDIQMQSRNVSSAMQGWTNGMYKVLSGNGSHVTEVNNWYKAIYGTQDYLRATLLGGALTSALGDGVFHGMAARMNGMGATKAIGQFVKFIGSKENRQMAAQQGYILESVLGSTFASARFADQNMGPTLTRFMSNFTNRAGGLQVWTDAGKAASVLELQAGVARTIKTSWEELGEDFKAALDVMGIKKEHYQVWQKAKPFNLDHNPEVSFIRPEDVMAVGSPLAREAALLLSDWQERTASVALNEPSLRTRAITTGGGAAKGTAQHAFFTSLFMFKGFSLTMMFNHLIPSMERAARGKGGNLATLAIGMGMMGAVIFQIKQLLAGKEPADMDKPAFWRAAFLQGGGLGLFGDFAFGDQSRFGRDFLASMAGPMYGFGNDAIRLAKGNLDSLYNQDDPNFGRDLVKFVGRYNPVDTFWYSRLVIERTILDSLSRMADPNFDTRMNALEKKTKEDLGSGYWWKAGESSPEFLQ